MKRSYFSRLRSLLILVIWFRLKGEMVLVKRPCSVLLPVLEIVSQDKFHGKGLIPKKNRDAFHESLLFIGHQTGVKKELTAFENLSFYQKMNGSQGVTQDDIWLALAKVGLAGKEDIPAGKLSAGQQRRVALARLWLSKHPLWILDEPLTAIDKQGIKVIEALFIEHTHRGGMVLFTTHQDMFTDVSVLKTIRLGE